MIQSPCSTNHNPLLPPSVLRHWPLTTTRLLHLSPPCVLFSSCSGSRRLFTKNQESFLLVFETVWGQRICYYLMRSETWRPRALLNTRARTWTHALIYDTTYWSPLGPCTLFVTHRDSSEVRGEFLSQHETWQTPSSDPCDQLIHWQSASQLWDGMLIFFLLPMIRLE